MTASAVALAVAGPLAVGAAWLVVRSGRASVWLANGVVLPVLGVLSLLTGEIEATGGYPPWAAAAWGIVGGVGLYAATAGFMIVAGRWPPLARHTTALYENRRHISLPAALGISALLVAPGEELLWRGVVLEAFRTWIGSSALAPVGAWVVYVAANAVSGSLPIFLGAVVGGAAWTALAIFTGGVAASIACHVLWTALMVAFPPVARRR